MKKSLLLVLLVSHFFGYAQYTLIPDVKFEKALIDLGIDSGTPDGRVLTTNAAKVLQLDVTFSGITNLTGIEDFTLLKILYCNDNQLTKLNVTKNTFLEHLNCYFNSLIDLDLSNNKDLTYANCTNNKLLTLNVKNGTNSTKNLSINSSSNPNLICVQVDNKSYSDTNWYAYKDASASYSENCSKTSAAIAPPVIKATGNQIYCPGTSLNIVETISITSDPAEPETDALYIQISSGYISSQDMLTLSNPTAHSKIITSWDSVAGKLKLSSPTGLKIPYTDFEVAIKDIVYSNSSPNPSGTRNFSITIGQANFLPSTGHYYEFVSSIGITWTAAKIAAEASNYYGLKGYLATISSLEEVQISGEQTKGAGWIGGSDAATEGVWKWVTGPEGLANGGTGITFWNGLANGTTPNFAYWNTNEPNQYNGANEDYAHITAPGVGITGSWNDLTITGEPTGNYQPKGYIVEYGGMPGDPTLQISASTTITIPKITSTTPSSICGSGAVTLQATATDGAVDWYATPTGGTSLFTGNSFTTPTLTTTTSYYVDASNGNCPNRIPIIATVNTIPTITSTTPNSRCDSGTVTLGAVATNGTINWYNVPTGGTSIGNGNSFTTPTITATTTYYVDATSSGCTTLTRIPILATVTISPSITSTTPNSRCDSGTVTLGAVASKGTINWYDVPTGGTSIGTGNSFTTPTITATTTYYVDATSSGCTTLTRIPILATVTIYPSITSTTPNFRCDSGTVTLGAVASNGTINWYDVPTGGNSIGTGNSFTTPTITSTTTYYVDATSSGCTTLTRIPILATVTISPSIISTTPNSRCDSGIVTLGAVATNGTINWYNVPTGGTSIGTGNSFITPSITATTTYYVDAISSGCTSPRVSITATIYPVLSTNEEVVLCQTEMATLDASIPGMNYLWSPGGEITQTIVVSSIGNYSVIISSPLANCDSKKNIKVIEHPKPIIKEVIVAENSITIQLDTPQNYYEYSIDGIFFKTSNQFSYIPSGKYTAFVREKNLCNLVTQDFTIFTIAKYFTPNGDGFNDVWEIKEMKDFPSSSTLIFNRYGKLITTLSTLKYSWNGLYKGSLLPSDDYWYVLNLGNGKPEIRGHFSLKR